MGVTRPLALGIVADAKNALEGLVRVLRTRQVRPRDGTDLARYRKAARAWWDEPLGPVKSWAGPGIHPAHALQAIGTAFGCGPRRLRALSPTRTMALTPAPFLTHSSV